MRHAFSLWLEEPDFKTLNALAEKMGVDPDEVVRVAIRSMDPGGKVKELIARDFRKVRAAREKDAEKDAPARRALVLAVLSEHLEPVLGLARIPAVVKAAKLEKWMTIEQVHRALLELNESGVIELRPESGGEFLTSDDRALCPAGPRGSVFSYARKLKR